MQTVFVISIVGCLIIASFLVKIAHMMDNPEEWDETARCVNEDDTECWPKEEDL